MPSPSENNTTTHRKCQMVANLPTDVKFLWKLYETCLDCEMTVVAAELLVLVSLRFQDHCFEAQLSQQPAKQTVQFKAKTATILIYDIFVNSFLVHYSPLPTFKTKRVKWHVTNMLPTQRVKNVQSWLLTAVVFDPPQIPIHIHYNFFYCQFFLSNSHVCCSLFSLLQSTGCEVFALLLVNYWFSSQTAALTLQLCVWNLLSQNCLLLPLNSVLIF